MTKGVVFFLNKRLERYKIQNINLLIQIDVILLKTTIYKIQEYVGHIQEENERQQVMFI